MDRTILNIMSLLLGSTGLFAVLLEYDVPELMQDYWDGNPFAIKAASIKQTLRWPFIAMALAAVFLQVLAEVVGDALPVRLHPAGWYVVASGAGLVVAVALLMCLSAIGRAVARRAWRPAILEGQSQPFYRAKFVVTHGGWREDQLPAGDSLPDSQRLREANLREAEKSIAQIERLLDCDDAKTDLRVRVARLEEMFDENREIV